MLIGYARVSTYEQNIELQLDALRSAGCTTIFQDFASGDTCDRPELFTAIASMQARQDKLVVWKLDRLARSLKQLMDIMEFLEQKQLELQSLTEAIDTTTTRKLTFYMYGMHAEYEKLIISDRARAGIRIAQRKGNIHGRPKVLQNDKLALAKKLLLDDETFSNVAKQVKVSVATLHRYFPGGKAVLMEEEATIQAE